MNSTTELILNDKKIAYALTDSNLKIVELSGPLTLFSQNSEPHLGCPLPEVVPELIGTEDVLADILAGVSPRFDLTWVNRENISGQTVYLAMTVLPHRQRDGKIDGVIYLIQDLTDLGTLEQQVMQSRNELRLLQSKLTEQNLKLQAANAELKRLDEIKSMFVSTAAHELRSPLASILGYVELLLDQEVGALKEEQRRTLEIIQQSGFRQLALSNNLLDVTRIETGQIDLMLMPEALPAIIETIAVEMRPQLQAKVQQLILRTTPDLPKALIDKVRVSQIISNLMGNAIKYTPEGGVITVSVAPAVEEGFLQVNVADTGVGIPLEDQSKLFTRFFRGNKAFQAGVKGTGLGLYITKALVDHHGGRIWFESTPRVGSTFHVTLPALAS